MLDFVYQHNQDVAQQLLTYELRNWSRQTCLSLAVTADHKRLLAHPSCQVLLAELWMGGLNLRRNTNLKVLLSVLFPPAMLQLEFRTQEELRQMPQTEEEYLMEHCEDEEDRSDEDDDDPTGADEVGDAGGAAVGAAVVPCECAATAVAGTTARLRRMGGITEGKQ